MKVKWLTTLLLIQAVAAYAGPSSAYALTYSCRTIEGSLLFTDDPASIPAGCRDLPKARDRGGGTLSIVQFPKDFSLSTSVRAILAEIENERAEQNRLRVEWEQEALGLVEQFKAATRRMLRTHDAYLDAKLRTEIRDIKTRRDDLLAKNEAENLPYQERDIVPKILAEIPP